MCLEIVTAISPAAKGRISARRLSQITGLAVSSRKAGSKPVLHFAVTGGCSCEFLSDDAEFESETWILAAPHLSALALAVSTLAKECKSFSFLAHWLNGERPRQTRPISSSALAKLVQENKVGNNVLYVVG
jgi:hypothetical protein